jgi:hypothetical protein
VASYNTIHTWAHVRGAQGKTVLSTISRLLEVINAYNALDLGWLLEFVACKDGMKNASRLVDALADLTVEDICLDGSRETFDGNSNLRVRTAKVRRTDFTMILAFKPYIGVL